METISRKQAKALGLNRFFTGKVCSNGHVDERYVRDYTCVSCKRERTHRTTTSGYFKTHYTTNRDQHLARSKKYAQQHPDKVSAASNAWNKRNKERMDEYRKEYYSNADNKQRQLDSSKEYRNNHKEKYAAHCRTRQAAKLQRTPAWLTSDDHQAIEQMYAEAQKLTTETGVRHVVDHYYPLQGRTVSGLHHPNNLQVIAEAENIAKKNKHPDRFYR